MSRQDFILPPRSRVDATPPPNKRRIVVFASPDGGAATTIVDTPTERERESERARRLNQMLPRSAVHAVVEQPDDDGDDVSSPIAPARTSGSSLDDDDDADSAELGEEQSEHDLQPSERLVLAVERATRILEQIQPVHAAKCRRNARTVKSPLFAYIEELWNACTRASAVEPNLNRSELETLWRVARHLQPHPHTCRALPIGADFIAKEYRLISRPGDVCNACGYGDSHSELPSSTETDCLCDKCLRALSHVRQTLTSMLLRNNVQLSSPTHVYAPLNDLEKSRAVLRVKRTL